MKEKVPWVVNLVDRSCKLMATEMDAENFASKHRVQNLGVVIVKLFWTAPEQDYIKAFFMREEQAVVSYDNEELLTWAGGVALTKERQRILQLANRNNKAFDE